MKDNAISNVIINIFICIFIVANIILCSYITIKGNEKEINVATYYGLNDKLSRHYISQETKELFKSFNKNNEISTKEYWLLDDAIDNDSLKNVKGLIDEKLL